MYICAVQKITHCVWQKRLSGPLKVDLTYWQSDTSTKISSAPPYLVHGAEQAVYSEDIPAVQNNQHSYHTSICTQTDKHTCICTGIHTCAHICACIHTHACMHARTHMHTHTHTSAHTHTHTQPCKHTHAHIRMHIHTYAHTHTLPGRPSHYQVD